MGMWIGRNRKARVTYGFDEIALVPGEITINPNEVDTTFLIPRRDQEPLKLQIPILASAMDGVTDVGFAVEMGRLGGLAVLNLEGVQTRYKFPQEALSQVLEADKNEVTALLQKLYQEPVQEELIAMRVKQIKEAGMLAAVSSIPQKAAAYGKIAEEAGADVFVVQSTVSTVKHISTEYAVASADVATSEVMDRTIPIGAGLRQAGEPGCRTKSASRFFLIIRARHATSACPCRRSARSGTACPPS